MVARIKIMNLSPSSLSLGIATFQAQALNAMFESKGTDSSFMDIFTQQLQGTDGNSTDALAAFTGTSATTSLATAGRNMALFDPESAYGMMTEINRRDVYYKAQYAELSGMGSGLTNMEAVGAGLAETTISTTDESIKSSLQSFVDQYNGWVKQFAPDIANGGLLADTQAAQVSLHELQESVRDGFYGIKDGVHGLRDLGISIDPSTKLATLDATKLAGMLASNKQGVVDTAQEFGASFAKSADLLNSEGNFMPRRLDNLQRVIHYIADNKTDLQAEFGTGDSAKPTGKVAEALAAYNQSYAV
jgi:flagellar capping protein FliD